MENESALRRSIIASKWMFLNTIFQKITSFGSFLILARILTPNDFGIISLITILPSFLDLLTTFGFETTLIQSKEKEDFSHYLNTVWTFNIIKSLIIFAVIFFTAPYIASFFKIQQAVSAIRMSGFFVVLPSLSNIAQILFFKEINFKKIFVRDAVSSLAYAVFGIFLALFLKSFWALFLALIAQNFFASLITYFLHEFKPRLSFKFGNLINLINYSKWIYGQNLVNRAIPLIEGSIIGKLLSPTGVGLYTKANSVASIPSSPVYNIVGRVAFPVYSKIQDSKEKIIDGFLKSLDILFLVTVPFFMLWLIASHRIILILLGEKWLEVDFLLKIFSITVIINALSYSLGPVFNAINKPKTQLKIGLLNMAALIFFLLLLIPFYGVKGAVFGSLITSFITSVSAIVNAVKILNIKIMEIIKSFFVFLVVSILTFALGKLILFNTGYLTNIKFLFLIGFLAVIYFALIILSGIFFKARSYATLKLIWDEFFKK